MGSPQTSLSNKRWSRKSKNYLHSPPISRRPACLLGSIKKGRMPLYSKRENAQPEKFPSLKRGARGLFRVSFFLRHLPSYSTPVSRRFQSRNGLASVDNQFLC